MPIQRPLPRDTITPPLSRRRCLGWLGGSTAAVMLGACAQAPQRAQVPNKPAASPESAGSAALFRGVNRLTWGADEATLQLAAQKGWALYVEDQLQWPANDDDGMPPAIAQRVAQMQISNKPLLTLLREGDAIRRQGDIGSSEDDRKTAQQAYHQQMSGLAREAAERHLWRALYSPAQLREHMTAFWLNHFSVHAHKHNLRALIGDYESRAIRPHALGRFRDLLGAVAHHPAMLRYLDNDQNAAGHLNENYARELLELHTLGVNGGYSQRDVQELARVLTGFGYSIDDARPPHKPELQHLYRREGAFEFLPRRHDFADKTVLGQSIRGRGPAELEQVLDILATHPATARFVSHKLVSYFLTDTPPEALVSAMAQAFSQSQGDIAATMRVLLMSDDFRSAQHQKFKDPMHYALSALRLGYDASKPILNLGPVLQALQREGQMPGGHLTPDGYPTTAQAWASAAQMSSRFDWARQIAQGQAQLFRGSETDRPKFLATPQFQGPLFQRNIAPLLGKATVEALRQASNATDWAALFLSSPEFMYR